MRVVPCGVRSALLRGEVIDLALRFMTMRREAWTWRVERLVMLRRTWRNGCDDFDAQGRARGTSWHVQRAGGRGEAWT